MSSDWMEEFRNIAFEKRGAILQMQLHTGGGPLIFGAKDHNAIHAQLGEAFYRIARDPDVRILIITGAGDEFMTTFDPKETAESFDVAFWSRITQEGKDILNNYLDVGAVVISAVNGPATLHAEIPTMADIVIASETAVFSDPHVIKMGMVPGDGSHVWWPMLLGPTRGRSFLILGQEISAREGLQLGFVTEVVSHARTLPRAWEIATELAKLDPLLLRNTRLSLTQDIKRRMLNDLGYGLALEGLVALSK